MSERWKPECHELYYYTDAVGVVSCYVWRGDSTDNLYYESGNCFKTRAEAKAAAKKYMDLLLSLHDNDETLKDKPLPKLTAEVFNRPDCPKWAKYAAVDINGTAHYYDERPYPLGTSFYNNRAHSWSVEGYFDASDWQNSLIERPAKETNLPDWCRVGEWVWAIAFNAYFKVNKVDGLFIRGTDFSGSDYCVAIEHVRQAHPRPYNADEMRELIGKAIDSKHGSRFLATEFFPDDGGKVRVYDIVCNADALFECYTINGKPCGVLEHLDEKGEWVK